MGDAALWFIAIVLTWYLADISRALERIAHELKRANDSTEKQVPRG